MPVRSSKRIGRASLQMKEGLWESCGDSSLSSGFPSLLFPFSHFLFGFGGAWGFVVSNLAGVWASAHINLTGRLTHPIVILGYQSTATSSTMLRDCLSFSHDSHNPTEATLL